MSFLVCVIGAGKLALSAKSILFMDIYCGYAPLHKDKAAIDD